MDETPTTAAPPAFDEAFRAQFEALLRWRRDVRRFREDPVDAALVDRLIALAGLAPSVGNSQPWRFVKVDDPARRRAVRASFEACNRDALADYRGERARLYASLKLAGLDRAPVHPAVYADTATALGDGLGRRTMPEMLQYSVVTAVHGLWLAARAYGLGVGYPEEEHVDPELERHRWQERIDVARCIVQR